MKFILHIALTAPQGGCVCVCVCAELFISPTTPSSLLQTDNDKLPKEVGSDMIALMKSAACVLQRAGGGERAACWRRVGGGWRRGGGAVISSVSRPLLGFSAPLSRAASFHCCKQWTYLNIQC